MQLIRDGRKSTNTLGIALTIFAVLTTAGFVWGHRFDSESAERNIVVGKHHRCITPMFDASAAFACEAEAAAYANALDNLETAQYNADQAYEAWYECEHGTPPSPSPEDPPEPESATFSILEPS